MKKLTPWLLLVATSLLSSGAFAQWQWLDKDGQTVFSDRAPPLNIPEKNILKRPGRLAGALGQEPVNTSTQPNGTPVAPEISAVSAPKVSGIDKELAEKKKKSDQAEAAKRKAEEDRISKARADNCTRAKLAKTSLDSGIRLGRVNAQGEHEVMDDAARLLESKRLQGIIDSDCH